MIKTMSRLASALLETAGDMREAGLMDEAAHSKITMRHIGSKVSALSEPIAPEDIRAMREQAHVSQAVFARQLNLTVGYVSQLERGVKRPTGAALALLNVVKKNGFAIAR